MLRGRARVLSACDGKLTAHTLCAALPFVALTVLARLRPPEMRAHQTPYFCGVQTLILRVFLPCRMACTNGRVGVVLTRHHCDGATCARYKIGLVKVEPHICQP